MKKLMLFVCLLALCNLSLFAQTEKRPRVIHTKEKSAIHLPPQAVPEGLKTIYTNLVGLKAGVYNNSVGSIIEGPNAVGSGGTYTFLAMPFTPKADSHVTRVQVAVQHLGSAYGASQVNLSIYSGDDPQSLVAGPVTVTNLSEAGTCCTLAVADFSPVAVSAGYEYWVVASTPLTGTGSDSVDVWDAARPLLLYAHEQGGEGGGEWSWDDGDLLPAGGVLGTIP